MAKRAQTVTPVQVCKASVHARARKSGTVWDVMFRVDGAQRSRSFTNEELATKWANLVRYHGPAVALAELNGDTLVDAASRRTFDELARSYIASRSGVEGKTVEDYDLFLRTGISAAFGMLGIQYITQENLAAWVRDEERGTRSAKTIKNRFGFISAVFNYAVNVGATARNPCRLVKLPQVSRKEPVFLSPAEVAEILRFLPERERDLALFIVSTGLRWGEVSALAPSDIDLTRRIVRVNKAWKYSKEKGWYIGKPKSSRSNRTVPLSDELMPMLRRRLVTAKGLLFTNRRGTALRQQRFYEGYWKPAVRMANGLPAYDLSRTNVNVGWTSRAGSWWDQPSAPEPLGKSPRVHDLRHKHASWLIAAGIPLTVVQRRLGHESIKTTNDIYGHLSEEHERTAANATSEMIQGVMAGLTPAA